MRYTVFLLILIMMSGCLVRSYTVEKPRVDTDVSGNRGYLAGAPAEEQTEIKETRPVTVFEFELGSHRPRKKKAVAEQPAAVEEEAVESYMEEEVVLEEEVYPVIEETVESAEENYTVQENDTLQKISRKFYGTTKKYLQLYEYNKDVLKSPDRLYPGMGIKIPVLN